MDTCTVETGLLKKKPCGQPSITRCLNCEQPLCSKHAVAQVSATGRKSGKFLCKECDLARIEYEKTTPVAAPSQPEKKAPAAEKSPAAAAAKAPAAPAKAAPAEPAKPEDAPLEFTPSEKKK